MTAAAGKVDAERFLGYTKDENGNLAIDPEQADIVKRIYREYLEGSSMDKIAAALMADGILTGAGKTKWHTSTINKILRLRDQRRQAEVDSVIKDEQMKQIHDLQDFVKGQPATIAEFDETLVSRLIEKITVFDDRFTIDFKSGITIDIEA